MDTWNAILRTNKCSGKVRERLWRANMGVTQVGPVILTLHNLMDDRTFVTSVESDVDPHSLLNVTKVQIAVHMAQNKLRQEEARRGPRSNNKEVAKYKRVGNRNVRVE